METPKVERWSEALAQLQAMDQWLLELARCDGLLDPELASRFADIQAHTNFLSHLIAKHQ